jgi:hypothetical protein
MAGTFPGQQIEYADVSPSGRIPAVGAQMPATGGLEAIGGALQQLGEKVDAQESALELSQGQRQIEEKGFALVNSATTDPDANEKAWAQYEKDTQGIIGSMKHGNAQRALQIHANEHLPQWQQTFKTRELAVRSANAADQMEFEATALLGRGDVGGAATIYQNARDTKAITQKKYDFLMANIFTNSALEMARIDIGTGNYEQAQKQLEGLKGLNDAQLDQRDRLLADLHKVKDPQVEQDRVSIAEQIEAGTATFASIQATTLDQKEKDSSWTHAQEVTRMRAKGETIATDQDSRIAANEVVLAYKDGLIQRKDALAGISKYQTKINPTEFKQITDDIYHYADNKDPIKQRKISEYNKTFSYLASKNKLVDGDRKTNMLAAIEYQAAFGNWTRDNPDASDAEITDKFNELTKKINLWWDTPSRDLAVVRERTAALTPVAIPTTLQPARPVNIPPDAVWDDTRKMWTYIRNGRLKGIK